MEVAGQWRREWAGTAEYGKVTEGGVTRRVARAMEVLHASAPGAKVRVMRAAYHSTSGPGAPSASFLMHSTRRVLSSGFDFLEEPSLQSKPLEISSTPLELNGHESSPELENENYKVTEPDDTDISEPSKWRGSTGQTSIRMPSEESSSTDNTSIIDLDSKNHKSAFRKYSYDSESSDLQSTKINRFSPLLENPTTLSTLKYKSLLNGSNDWNNRRKSYSFEDTAPLSESMLHSNETLAMESSTDSGICKSTELVNDNIDDTNYTKYLEGENRKVKETFQDWLHKNRSSPFNRNIVKPHREKNITEDPIESKITLQSPGKICITLPVTLETEEEYRQRKLTACNENDKRTKRVEFCKTELHFAAESGKVNIIATDEKPPPTNDFRRRRSAFVPIKDNFEKPITLFGDKKDFPEITLGQFSTNSEVGEIDENTAATKSILKNKIPKPKPYLLGENMGFGHSNVETEHQSYNSVRSAVSMINTQLKPEQKRSTKSPSLLTNGMNQSEYIDKLKSTKKDSLNTDSSEGHKTGLQRNINLKPVDSFKRIDHKNIQMSARPRTRQLKESDLTYFGVNSTPKNNEKEKQKSRKKLESIESSHSGGIDDLFHSVRLIQQVSNSVCSSEAESEDVSGEYQNLPLRSNFAPIPTPRSRYKNNDLFVNSPEPPILKPINEQNDDDNSFESRRARVKKREDTISTKSRSLSEPPKVTTHKVMYDSEIKKNIIRDPAKIRSRKNSERYEKENSTEQDKSYKLIDDEVPIYENVDLQNHSTNKVMHPEIIIKSDSIRKTQSSKCNKNKSIQQDIGKSRCAIDKSKDNRTDEHSKNTSLKKQRNNTKRTDLHKEIEGPSSAKPDTFNTEIGSNKSSKKKTIDEHTLSVKRKRERRSPQRHPNDCTTLHNNKNIEIKKSVPLSRIDNKEKEVTHPTKEVSNVRKESTVSRQKSTHEPQRSTNHKNDVKRNIDTSLDRQKRHSRSEYVINYDDKNGTVSSICKVRPVPIASKKRKSSKTREGSRDVKVKDKTSDKTLRK